LVDVKREDAERKVYLHPCVYCVIIVLEIHLKINHEKKNLRDGDNDYISERGVLFFSVLMT